MAVAMLAMMVVAVLLGAAKAVLRAKRFSKFMTGGVTDTPLILRAAERFSTHDGHW